MRRLSLIFALAFLAVSTLRAEEKHTTDSLDTVKKNVADGKAIILDVREQREWDAGQVKGAMLLPLSKLAMLDADKLPKDLPKDKIIYTHCARGKRALMCATKLQKAGYKVRALKPGYTELIEAGFEKE